MCATILLHATAFTHVIALNFVSIQTINHKFNVHPIRLQTAKISKFEPNFCDKIDLVTVGVTRKRLDTRQGLVADETGIRQ